MSQSTITFLVLGAAVAVFVWDRLPVAVVAVGVALSLWATDVLELEEALAGFGDPTVIFIASLFVVSEALDATGVTAWAGQRLMDAVGQSRTRLVFLTMLLVAGVTALISVNGAVAALLPVAVLLAIRLGRSPSQLLMPVAFAAHAGSLLVLTGTPVNVIVSDAAEDAGVGGFGFFEFALVGVPLLAGTIAFVLLFGERLLPERTARSIPPDLSDLARTLARQYSLEHDRLITRERGVAEVVVSPRSELIGAQTYPGQVTDSGDFVVLGVQRRGDDLEEEATLAVGDTLLLRGPGRARAGTSAAIPDVLVVDQPERIRRQAVPLGTGLGACCSCSPGDGGPARDRRASRCGVAGLLAAGAIVLLGALTIDQAYRGISWTTVILVGGMISLSTAMTTTGAAAELADGLVDLVGDSGGHALLLGLFVLTAVLGQLISNMATALIVIPIALSAAASSTSRRSPC